MHLAGMLGGQVALLNLRVWGGFLSLKISPALGEPPLMKSVGM